MAPCHQDRHATLTSSATPPRAADFKTTATTEASGTDWQQLALTEIELAALRRQGFVHAAQAANGQLRFKLRFRVNGQQRVKYLGSDPVFVQQVQQQLEELQAARRLQAEVRGLARQATVLLQQSKQRLTPLLDAAGMHFHGTAIRRYWRPGNEQGQPEAVADAGED